MLRSGAQVIPLFSYLADHVKEGNTATLASPRDPLSLLDMANEYVVEYTQMGAQDPQQAAQEASRVKRAEYLTEYQVLLQRKQVKAAAEEAARVKAAEEANMPKWQLLPKIP